MQGLSALIQKRVPPFKFSANTQLYTVGGVPPVASKWLSNRASVTQYTVLATLIFRGVYDKWAKSPWRYFLYPGAGYTWTTSGHQGNCEIFPCLVFWGCYKNLQGTSPRSRNSPRRCFALQQEERVYLMIPAILQYVAGGIKMRNPMWSNSLIYQHPAAWEGLLPPSFCRWATLTSGILSVHGEKDGNVEFHWKNTSSITSCYPLSTDLDSFKSCEHKQVSLGSWKQQNKAIFTLLYHQDINPQTARQILKLLQWWWKRKLNLWSQWRHPVWFSGDTSTFFWFTPVGSTMTLSSIVDNRVTPGDGGGIKI